MRQNQNRNLIVTFETTTDFLSAKIRTVEANLKQEKEKNAQLEALILALSSKLEMFHSLASSLDIEVKVIIRYRLFPCCH